jgi:holo-[acyl-carrier protein] synthase
MIRGVGTDIVAVGRIERASRRCPELLERLFTATERAYCEKQHRCFESYAARFAAKEALLKALGTGGRDGISWQDMEVVRDGRGRPELVLGGQALEAARRRGVNAVHLSLSHSREYATAVVVLEERT